MLKIFTKREIKNKFTFRLTCNSVTLCSPIIQLALFLDAPKKLAFVYVDVFKVGCMFQKTKAKSRSRPSEFKTTKSSQLGPDLHKSTFSV